MELEEKDEVELLLEFEFIELELLDVSDFVIKVLLWDIFIVNDNSVNCMLVNEGLL